MTVSFWAILNDVKLIMALSGAVMVMVEPEMLTEASWPSGIFVVRSCCGNAYTETAAAFSSKRIVI